jgi:hypothetical protein
MRSTSQFGTFLSTARHVLTVAPSIAAACALTITGHESVALLNVEDSLANHGCSASVRCVNGECRCAGSKSGAACDGEPKNPSSCDVVCPRLH